MSPPPYLQLQATPYALWNRSLYPQGTTPTITTIINGPAGSGLRFAYGNAGGFWFHVALTPAEEPQFDGVYRAWRTANPGSHIYNVHPAGRIPPTCGTPTTPPCPPDDVLYGPMRNLRDRIAGVGAGPAQLEAAMVKVQSYVIASLEAAIALAKK